MHLQPVGMHIQSASMSSRKMFNCANFSLHSGYPRWLTEVFLSTSELLHPLMCCTGSSEKWTSAKAFDSLKAWVGHSSQHEQRREANMWHIRCCAIDVCDEMSTWSCVAYPDLLSSNENASWSQAVVQIKPSRHQNQFSDTTSERSAKPSFKLLPFNKPYTLKFEAAVLQN